MSRIRVSRRTEPTTQLNRYILPTPHPFRRRTLSQETRDPKNTESKNIETINVTVSKPKLTLIIPTYNAANLLTECLINLQKTLSNTTRVLIVDDSLTNNTSRVVADRFPNYQLTQTRRNLGFAGACNHGLTQVQTPYVGFLNNDAFPESNWAESLTRELEQDPKAAIICSKIYRKNTQTIDSAGGIIEYPLGEAPPRGYLEPERSQYDEPAEVAYASGTAMIARTSLLRELGGFDESYRNYHEETDLSWRLRLGGYKIRYSPKPTAQHIGSYTMSRAPARKTFWQTRNRCTTNLKNLGAEHIPHWLLYEMIYASLISVGGLIFPSYRNHAFAYIVGLLSFARSLQPTLRKRVEVQSRRRVSDAEILKLHRRVSVAMLIRRNLRLVQTQDGHLFAPEILDKSDPKEDPQ